MMKGKRLLFIVLSAVLMLTLGAATAFADDDAIDIESPAVTVEGIGDTMFTNANITFDALAVKYTDPVSGETETLVEETDYTVEYKNNFDVTVNDANPAEVVLAGIGRFEGSRTETFKITKNPAMMLQLTDDKVAAIPDQDWKDGAEVKPEPVVTDGDRILVKDVNYTLTYANNTDISDNAKVIVTGIGQYEGSTVTKIFRIVEPAQTIGDVQNLKSIAGYQEIKLTWDPVEGADTYYIVRKVKGQTITRDVHKLVNDQTRSYVGYTWEQVAQHPFWEAYVDIDMYKKYSFTVYAVKRITDPQTGATKEIVSENGAKANKKMCVNYLRIKVKVKGGVTLHSYDSSKTYTVHAGDSIITTGYGGGKYYFSKNGAHFRIMNIRTYGEKALYDKKKDYTKEEAEYFINNDKLDYARPNKTSKSYFIWASLYTQHVYAFKKAKGEWKLVEDWDCSSGTPDTPSPTGNCAIGKRIEWRHHTHYWNCFSTLNALHGIKPVRYAGYDWTRYLGQVKSNGCIRNRDANAGWIWNHCGKGTKVLVH